MSQEKQSKHGIPFAWHPQSQLMVSPAEVANGLACKCICVACTARLIARQGGARIWHFAHHRESNCAFAAEMAIHWMAKQLIFERMGIFVPHRSLSKTVHGKSRVWSEKLYVDVQQSGFQHITDCWIEKSIGGASTESGYRRPDLIAQLDGRPIAIEIYNTHAVDVEKTEWLKQQGFSVLEIDVSDLAILSTNSYKDALEQRLFGTDIHACWLAHMGDSEAWDRLDKLEQDVRIEKKSEEEGLLARLKAREAKNQRKAAFLKRIRDVEHLNIPFERCTLRVGRNEERVTLKIYGHASNLIFSKAVSLARQYGGKYNPRGRCWEFYTYQQTKVFFDLLGAKSHGILDASPFTPLQSAVPPKEAAPSPVLVCAKHSLPIHFDNPDLQELFDERAGMFEYEGGMSREKAEQHAIIYVESIRNRQV
jgi:hypothetical protein